MATIPLWNKCNNNCLMCSNPPEFVEGVFDFSEGYFKKSFLEMKKGKNIFIDDGATKKIAITGGEPTMNPNFFKIAAEIRCQFPDDNIILLTNGRRCAYDNYAKKILTLDGLNEIIVPIHGYNRKTHDAITRAPGSFSQTAKGIKNLFKYRKPDQKIEIRIIINRLNLNNIEKILSLIRKKFILADSVPLIFMEFEGQGKKNWKTIGIKYSDFKNKFKDIAPFFDILKDLRLYHFPLCVVPVNLWPYVWRTLPASEVSFIKSCKSCFVRKYCLGIHNEYLKLFGTREFKPISKKITVIKNNSWHRPINKVIV